MPQFKDLKVSFKAIHEWDATVKGYVEFPLNRYFGRYDRDIREWIPVGPITSPPENVTTPYGMVIQDVGTTMPEIIAAQQARWQKEDLEKLVTGVVNKEVSNWTEEEKEFYARVWAEKESALESGKVDFKNDFYNPEFLVDPTVATRDATRPPVWAACVQGSWYTQYGVLPIVASQVLTTKYSGHEWGLIHQALKDHTSTQLSDGLCVYSSTEYIDVYKGSDEEDIHPNVLHMIDAINIALHIYEHHKPHILQIHIHDNKCISLGEYVESYFTPYPPLPPIETGF